MNINKLLGDHVLVEVDEGEKITEGGIVINKKPNPGDCMQGIVRYIGKGQLIDKIGHVPIDPDIIVGTKVLFWYGRMISLNGKNLMLVNESDIILTILE